MKHIGTCLVIAITSLALAACGGKKKNEGGGGGAPAAGSTAGSAPAAGSTGGSAPAAGSTGGSAPAAGSTGGSAVATPDPVAKPDYIKAIAGHVDEAKGPVDVTFSKWTITKATIKDLANLEGSTAELEVDPTSLASGNADRDDHLKSPDFLDVGKYTTVKVVIDNVKRSGDKSYTADAVFSIHGVEKKVPATFDVVTTTADSVTVHGTAAISRLDFGMSAIQDKVKPELTLDVQLTFKKS